MVAASDDELTDAILLAARAMVGVAVRSLQSISPDLTLAQYRALAALSSCGPTGLADLAAELGGSPSTTTRMCDRLVRKGLATRRRSDRDRREVDLDVSDEGRRTVELVTGRRLGEIHSILHAVPDPAREQLVASLQLLADAAGGTRDTTGSRGWEAVALSA